VGAFVAPYFELPHAMIEPSQTHSLTKAISKFIQMQLPLPLLKPTVQSRCGVVVQKLSKLPHDVIEPSALRAAKALSVE
jgi:hypothetical protein